MKFYKTWVPNIGTHFKIQRHGLVYWNQALYCDLQNLRFSTSELWNFEKNTSLVPQNCCFWYHGYESGALESEWRQTAWVWTQALHLTSCLIIRNSPKHFAPQFLHLYNGASIIIVPVSNIFCESYRIVCM